MSKKTNAYEVARWLTRVVTGFNFKMRGEDRSLGRDLCSAVANNIADHASEGENPGGEIWLSGDPNSQYSKSKVKNYGWQDPPPTNYKTGQMLSLNSLIGNPKIEETRIEMTYGTGTTPSGQTWSPVDNRTESQTSSDDSVTDVQKAEWAHEGDRGFYYPTDEMQNLVIEVAGKALDRYLREVK